jgi:hypothetical protein
VRQTKDGKIDNDVLNTINNLLTEKQNVENKIKELYTTLEKIVEQQEKDAPFIKSMKRLMDDKRFNDQV